MVTLARLCMVMLALVAAATTSSVVDASAASKQYGVKSGMKVWVDPETPEDRQSYVSSRGRPWDLVMSDEFNIPNRDFRPGKDHLWTSLEKPDGVNGAKEIYNHNLTSTTCSDDGTCYFYIEIVDEYKKISVYNMYLNPPAYETVEFFYRAGMLQSWNKFCFQGGMLEVRAQLPGAVSSKSGNPDLLKGPNGKTEALAYYPTWPGIWMMGNLGRAIFSASTNRMWPFSYDECNPDVFDPKNQRISACDANPGFGLNPNQGRGAPEIDLLEGGGVAISSSLQIAPGMPPDFRLFPVNNLTGDNIYCLYGGSCKTPGANHPGVPTSLYNSRGHKSWYQELRYASNPFCGPDPTQVQTYEAISTSVKVGVEINTCTLQTCPGSKDVYADLGLIDGVGKDHWGVNYNGTCFPVMNAYMGSYLCDPDNQNKLCVAPRPNSVPKTNIMKPFNYQMDAISSNWPVHLGAYTDYLIYQMEWVTGKKGYVRWMLDGHPIFEVTADAFINVPQDGKKRNPNKVMLEEPMYLIFNVALSTSWGATPPNPGKKCRGDGKNEEVNRICNDFPMFMKIDYIRLYQDQATNLDKDNYMQVGCDPASHPTKEWINGHLDEYEDYDNLALDVAGGAFCTVDDDCTVQPTGDIIFSKLITGTCEKKRCVCTNAESWGGPRCSLALDSKTNITGKKKTSITGFGPPMGLAVGVAMLVLVLTLASVWMAMKNSHAQAQAVLKASTEKTNVGVSPGQDAHGATAHDGPVKVNYSQNFV